MLSSRGPHPSGRRTTRCTRPRIRLERCRPPGSSDRPCIPSYRSERSPGLHAQPGFPCHVPDLAPPHPGSRLGPIPRAAEFRARFSCSIGFPSVTARPSVDRPQRNRILTSGEPNICLGKQEIPRSKPAQVEPTTFELLLLGPQGQHCLFKCSCRGELGRVGASAPFDPDRKALLFHERSDVQGGAGEAIADAPVSMQVDIRSMVRGQEFEHTIRFQSRRVPRTSEPDHEGGKGQRCFHPFHPARERNELMCATWCSWCQA